MRQLSIIMCSVAVAALSACGGGGGDSAGADTPAAPSPGPGPAPAPAGSETAAACFNASFAIVGDNFKSSTRATYSVGGSALWDRETKTAAATAFNGTSAIRLQERLAFTPDAALAGGMLKPSVSNADYYYATNPTPDHLLRLGVETASEASGLTPGVKVTTVYGPFLKAGLFLAPGQSFTQSYTETITSSVAPTQVLHNDVTVKFNGFVTVTVPAGTFRTCEFVETGTVAVDSYAPRSRGTSTVRYGVGNGLEISSDVVTGDPRPPAPIVPNAVPSSAHFELLSATLNGKPLAP